MGLAGLAALAGMYVVGQRVQLAHTSSPRFRQLTFRGAGIGSAIGDILWIVLIGWWLALGHLASGIALCLTIIGIPLGLANFKIIPISLMPLGVRISPGRAF